MHFINIITNLSMKSNGKIEKTSVDIYKDYFES